MQFFGDSLIWKNQFPFPNTWCQGEVKYPPVRFASARVIQDTSRPVLSVPEQFDKTACPAY